MLTHRTARNAAVMEPIKRMAYMAQSLADTRRVTYHLTLARGPIPGLAQVSFLSDTDVAQVREMLPYGRLRVLRTFTPTVATTK